MTRLDWKPIRSQAVKAAEALGHKLGPFDSKTTGFGNVVRMASCLKCHGCCWMAFQNSGRGFGADGRLLKYRCGTPEAMGIKS